MLYRVLAGENQATRSAGGRGPRRRAGRVVPPAAAAVTGLLVSACTGTVSSAIKTLSPSLPARNTTAAAAPPPAAATSPAASSSSGSSLIWLWVILGLLVLIALIVLIARSGRRGPKPAEVWRSRALDAYAKGSALYDAMQLAEAPGALVAPDAAARWADIQRRADDLGQTVYAMREGAPDEDKRMRAADVLAALQSVRRVMAAERGTDVAAVPPPEEVRGRLNAFWASLQALREPDDRTPY